MKEICDICGGKKNNKIAINTIMDYVSDSRVVEYKIDKGERYIILDDGQHITLNDCDACLARKVKFVLQD